MVILKDRNLEKSEETNTMVEPMRVGTRVEGLGDTRKLINGGETRVSGGAGRAQWLMDQAWKPKVEQLVCITRQSRDFG